MYALVALTMPRSEKKFPSIFTWSRI